MKKFLSVLIATLMVLLTFCNEITAPIFGTLLQAEAKTTVGEFNYGLDCLLRIVDITKAQQFLRGSTEAIVASDKEYLIENNLEYGARSNPRTIASTYEGKDFTSYSIDARVDISRKVDGKFSYGTVFKASASDKFDFGVGVSYSTSSESYFSTTKIERTVGINSIDLDSENEYSYLRDSLKVDFKEMLFSADTKEEINAFFNKYGTHIITSYTYGGWVESSTATVNTSTNISGNLKVDYQTKADVEVGDEDEFGYGIAAAVGMQASVDAKYNSNGYETVKYNDVAGGTGGLNFTSDGEQMNTIYNDWLKDIKFENPSTADIVVDDHLELLGIWEILPDKGYEVQKARMEQVFMERLAQMDEMFYNEFIYSKLPSVSYKELPAVTSENDVYIPQGFTPIYTPEQFLNISNNLSGKYILMNDLDFAGYSVYPIGKGASFSGILDGNGFTIKNYSYYIKESTNTSLQVGIFASNSGTIKNLFVYGSSVVLDTEDKAAIKNGMFSVGMIAGVNNGTLYNCRVANSTVKSELYVKNGEGNTVTNYVGGLVGDNGGDVSFCSFQGVVTADNDMHTASNSSKNFAFAGGIVGSNYTGSIADCYSDAQVTSDVYSLHDIYYTSVKEHKPDVRSISGGIVGQVYDFSKPIQRCFSLGTPTSIYKINSKNNKYRNCGDLIAIDGKIYAFVVKESDGKESNASNIIFNCYYTGNYYTSHKVNSSKDSTFNLPSGCKKVNSYSEANDILSANGWDCSGSTPVFPGYLRKYIVEAICYDETLYEGDILADCRIKVDLAYPNASKQIIAVDDICSASYNFSESGEQEIFVRGAYCGVNYVGSIIVPVIEIKPTAVAVVNAPKKTTYLVGEKLDTNGMIMNVDYNDGSYSLATEGWSTNQGAADFTATGKQTIGVNYLGYKNSFDVVVYSVTPKGTTDTIVDNQTKFIYGLEAGIRSVDKYVSVSGGTCSLKYVMTENGFGTGTKVNLVAENSDVIGTYTVLIFGDVNGDGWYDGNDAFLVNLIVNGMLDKDDVGEAVWTAADCNHDGVIDGKDIDLLTGAGLLLNNVDQSAAQTELATNAFYIEYMGLINQSVEINMDIESNDTTVEDTDNVGQGLAPTENGNDFEAIFINIFEFLKKIFSFIVSLLF